MLVLPPCQCPTHPPSLLACHCCARRRRRGRCHPLIPPAPRVTRARRCSTSTRRTARRPPLLSPHTHHQPLLLHATLPPSLHDYLNPLKTPSLSRLLSPLPLRSQPLSTPLHSAPPRVTPSPPSAASPRHQQRAAAAPPRSPTPQPRQWCSCRRWRQRQTRAIRPSSQQCWPPLTRLGLLPLLTALGGGQTSR